MLQKSTKITLLLILAIWSLWTPIAYTGISKDSMFSIHWINMIDAGIVSNETWTDSLGQTFTTREYGFKNLLWNQTNISDGYEVESYNFTNIPNVIGIRWDFQALFAKTENAVPIYEDLSPPYKPIIPFNGLNFQYSVKSYNPFSAEWSNNSMELKIPDYVTNYNISNSYWPDADLRLRFQYGTPEVKDVLQRFPDSQAVLVAFSTSWSVNLTTSSFDGHISDHAARFRRSAAVSMVVENGTALSASGEYTVQTGDTETIPITYRSVPLDLAIYVAFGLSVTSTVALVFIFRQGISKAFSRFRSPPNQKTPVDA